MRNPDRLIPLYTQVAELHKEKFPDWRIGQLFLNFLGWYHNQYKTDCFYVEDKEFLKRFKDFIEGV